MSSVCSVTQATSWRVGKLLTPEWNWRMYQEDNESMRKGQLQLLFMHSENLQKSLVSVTAELTVGAVYSLRSLLFIVRVGSDIVKGGSIRNEPSQQLLDDCTHERSNRRKAGRPVYQ